MECSYATEKILRPQALDVDCTGKPGMLTLRGTAVQSAEQSRGAVAKLCDEMGT